MNNIFKGKQLLQLIRANFSELMREPAVLFWGIIFPILMSIGLGAAFSTKQDVIRKVGIIRNNNSISSDSSTINNFLYRNAAKEYHENEKITYYSYKIKSEKLGNSIFLFQEINWKDAIVALKRGRINVVMEEKNNKISYSFDPSNPDAQLTYIKLTKFFPEKTAYISEEKTDNVKLLTLEGTRYIDFLIPGLLAMGVMMSSMWGISYTIIEKRSKKLLRRMVSTPMKKSYFLISIITVRFTMNFIEAALLYLFAHIAFGIHIQGSLPALITVFLAGNIAFSGLAVFISSNTSKTEIGNALINVVVMPMMILSGIFFSYHNFPDWFIPVIQKFPLTIMADDIRSIFIEGAGFAEIFTHSLILSITGMLFFITGVKFFKWY
jgi:ABC-type multidrug transport system permease subunit